MPAPGEHVLRLYLGLMEEVKVRLGQIARMTHGDIPLPARAIHEFCILQLRMVCELIALACLVAHGDDLADSKQLEKEWQAGRIVSELEKLHPGFFPVPVTMTQTFEPNGWHLEEVKSGFLTKAEFLELYNRWCGSSLHRGSLKHLLSSTPSPPIQFPEIKSWAEKIVTLLNKHRVVLPSGNVVLLCIMHNDQKAVQVAFAAAPDTST